jgi:acetylornithine deacetylase/succinyl-diaminopimelate desuccinylase-like protein
VPAAPAFDWASLGEETIEVLREYLGIDTTNPPGNETAGARFLARVLARDGIESRVIESAPGRGNLIARLAGDGTARPLILHQHIDVVYADRRYWSVDPFGGVIRDDFLYGRGALDMKALADTIRRREPRAVVLPEVTVAFTDNWALRRHGVVAYGFSPFVLYRHGLAGVHGNDERISLDNLRLGVRSYTELLLSFAAA